MTLQDYDEQDNIASDQWYTFSVQNSNSIGTCNVGTKTDNHTLFGVIKSIMSLKY